MEIYNHSLDHDHDSIHGPLLDSDPHFVSQAPFQAGAYISAGGYYDFNWVGAGTFARILDYNSATAEVTLAGKYIEDKIDAYPDLFAYPYGAYNAYLVDTFFPTYPSQHQTYAAFTTEKLWVSRTANRWKLGRFVRGRDWVTGPELEAILDSPPPPGC